MIALKSVRFTDDMSFPGNQVLRSWGDNDKNLGMALHEDKPLLEVTFKRIQALPLQVPLARIAWYQVAPVEKKAGK